MIPQPRLRLLLSITAALTIPAALGAAPRNNDTRSAIRPAIVAPAPAPAGAVAEDRRVGLLRRDLVKPAAKTDAVSRPRPTAPGAGALTQRFAATSSTKPTAGPVSILYAPSENDDPAYRAAIAAITGGTVDYFDTRVATPTALQLAAYTCVYTWVENSYSDRILFGDRLADFVDAGGKVILGPFCTYTTGFSLGGRIMTPAYSPVTSPSGTNHFSTSPYAGDGTRSLHAGVVAYDCGNRDFLVLQGAGIANGHYTDGEIAQAYRPDGRVVYSNGAGSIQNPGASGDWPKIVANIAMAHPASPGMLCAPTNFDDPSYRTSVATFTTGVVDYFDASSATPSEALLHTYDCIATWINLTPADAILFGDRLANRVDAGGRVILGVFTTFRSSPYYLDGRIMTPDYNPVASPSGINHYSLGDGAADGVTSLFTGVTTLETTFRDYLVGQGNGNVDGHYLDGEILAAYRPDGRVIYLNGQGAGGYGTGDWARLYANACTATFPAGHKMLFAPASGDIPDYRAQIAAQTGGAVDYFDASAGTPTLAQLLAYDCVYTLLNSNYLDKTLMGDRLADYADAGGRVILGVFTTYNNGVNLGLGGRIMTAAYSPVTSPSHNNHYASSSYDHDATTCFHRGIVDYATLFRDSLVLQGAGIRDGIYADNEITVAYRPDRRVVYVNGIGDGFGTGDWARLVANACDCRVTSGTLYGCNDAGQAFVVNRITGAGSFAYNLPTLGSTGATEIVANKTTGDAWVQSRDFNNTIQKFNTGTGLPTGAPVADGVSFNGLEWGPLGKLYGTEVSGFCGGSGLMTLNPATGATTTIGVTGQGPLTGVAFDARASALYGISGFCGSPQLVRFDVTGGFAATIGPVPSTYASLEFGPDGDLYAGGDFIDGGRLYRVSSVNGAVSLVGNPGYGGITGLMLAPPGTVDAQAAPSRLTFSTPYPNPSPRGSLAFRFTLPEAGDARLELYDVAGRLRWTKPMPGLGAGDHQVTWDGRASSGERLGPGVYQMRLVSPLGSRAVRVVRLD